MMAVAPLSVPEQSTLPGHQNHYFSLDQGPPTYRSFCYFIRGHLHPAMNFIFNVI